MCPISLVPKLFLMILSCQVIAIMVKRRGNEFGVAGHVIERREEFGIERSKLLDEIEMLVMSGDLPRVFFIFF